MKLKSVLIFASLLGLSLAATEVITESPVLVSESERTTVEPIVNSSPDPTTEPPLLNIEFNLKTIQWIGTNDSDVAPVPESPAEESNDVNGPAFPIVDSVNSTLNSSALDAIIHDLRTQGTPGYCQCRSKYYCQPPQRRKPTRTERVINTPLCAPGEVMCCATAGPGCGVSSPFPYFYPYPSYGEANYAEYPWTAVVMDTNNQFIFGLGVIVTPNLVLTTARNLEPYIGTPLKVRLGEWDLSSNEEPFKPLEVSVKEAVLHPQYNKRTFQNDLALLRLRTPIDLDSYPSLRSACLVRPEDASRFNGARCYVSGWGVRPSERQSDKNILKEVDMQVLDRKTCESAIRKSIGNPSYFFDPQSFVCAGGEPGRGLCKGDEGAALVCQDGPGSRYTVVGIASWGTSCGENPTLPGIFTNLATQFDWIRSIELSAGQKFGTG